MMGIRTIVTGMLLAVCGVTLAAWGADGVEAVDWGTWRVQVEERWPGIEGSWAWDKKPDAGIGLWRRERHSQSEAILDYTMRWMAEGDQGKGVAGMLAGELGMEERLEVVSFGRRGSEITLAMVLHPTGGVLSEWLKDVVRRKMGRGEGSRASVSLKEAKSAIPGGKRVLFAGALPDDLPAGEYRVVAEVRDETGQVKQRHEKRLVRPEKDVNPLESLSDEQLLHEYVKRGEALKGTGVEPVDSRGGRISAAFPYDSPPSMAWIATHQEIVRRGKVMVPALMTMLESEAVRNPGETSLHSEMFGFAFDVMRMLGEIGDPRPVPLLVRIMAGMDGKANLAVRTQAIETAEGLTHVTFHVVEGNGMTPVAVMHEWTLVTSLFQQTPATIQAGVSQVAEFYRKWLSGEGRDPAQWLPLARTRARKALAGSDPLAIVNAVTFLTISYTDLGHDDAPERTIQAIGRIVEHDNDSVKANKHRLSLAHALAGYGPAARKYVEYIIQDGKESGTWGGFRNLALVGGESAMAYMVGALPGLRRAVEDLAIDVNVDREHLDREANAAVLNYRACRWGIERWSGRTFDTDEEIALWWEQAKGKSQREWLEENLERTSTEADHGDTKAQYTLRCMVPDLPNAESDVPFAPPWWLGRGGRPYREKGPGAYREKWVKDNRAKLVYDTKRSCFVLQK